MSTGWDGRTGLYQIKYLSDPPFQRGEIAMVTFGFRHLTLHCCFSKQTRPKGCREFWVDSYLKMDGKSIEPLRRLWRLPYRTVQHVGAVLYQQADLVGNCREMMNATPLELVQIIEEQMLPIWMRHVAACRYRICLRAEVDAIPGCRERLVAVALSPTDPFAPVALHLLTRDEREARRLLSGSRIA